jgi:tRNA (cmo5U34)-methyltransferase
MIKRNYTINTKNASWSFKGNVFKKFDNHINKSVPLYKETHNLYLKLSDYFLQDKSRIVDIGCSTGTFLTSLYIKHINNTKKINYFGVDESKEMIRSAKKRNKKNQINFIEKNIFNFNLKNSCIISCLYTLMFISPKKRQLLVNKIYNNLNWGGAFFLTEKVRGPDARFQDIMNQVYIDFKLEQGFTAYEIIKKSRSLKSIQEPFSSIANLQMLKRAGFKDILTVIKYACFEGYLAIK